MRVPRIWEKLKAGLEAMVAGQEDAEVKARLEGAIDAAVAKVRLEQAGEPVPAELAAAVAAADEQLFAPLRAALGLDNVRWSVVGAAPTPIEVLEFFAAIGVPPCESVGHERDGRDRDDEHPGRDADRDRRPADPGRRAAARGRRRGVRARPERHERLPRPARADRRVRSAQDGWLATGDIAEIDADGYVRIVDRKKELIINAAGKNMSPANIEARIKSASPLIGQAVCIGDARPYNVALISLDPDGAAGHDPDEPGDACAGRAGGGARQQPAQPRRADQEVHDHPRANGSRAATS